MTQTESVSNAQAIAANELKVENEKLRNTIAAHEAALEQSESSRDEYRAECIEKDNRVCTFEVTNQQLHDLLAAVERQLEEVESVYDLLKKSVIKSAVKDDYMDKNLRSLRSLIEIAQSHNHSSIKA